jgi:hypothetical protein
MSSTSSDSDDTNGQQSTDSQNFTYDPSPQADPNLSEVLNAVPSEQKGTASADKTISLDSAATPSIKDEVKGSNNILNAISALLAGLLVGLKKIL